MDITKLGDDKLKALAYDTIVIIEREQKNLQTLSAELENRRRSTMNEELNTSAQDNIEIAIPEPAPAEEAAIPTEGEAAPTRGDIGLTESHIVA